MDEPPPNPDPKPEPSNPVAEPQKGVAASDAVATWWLTRFVILRLLGLTYLVAFLIAAHQFVPLVGERGVTPIAPVLERVEQMEGGKWQAVREVPTIFFWNKSDAFMKGVAWTGVALSAMVLLGFANLPIMLLLWGLYLSLSNAGGIWYGYGWDMQLPETGLLGALLCPWLDPRPFSRRAPPILVLWLYRWLIFRIMVGAFLIKWRGDPVWRDYTALFYHYETQPIPNPLARYLHFSPEWFHKLGVWWNHVIEAVVPAFIFLPALPLRKLSRAGEMARRIALWVAAGGVIGLCIYCHSVYDASFSPGETETPDLRLLYFFTWIALTCCVVPATKLGELPWMVSAFRIPRYTAGVLLILFQLSLIASGNLAFVNLLTIIPGLACLDDAFWRRLLPKFLTRRAVLAEQEERARRERKGHLVAHWSHLALIGTYALFAALVSKEVIDNLSNRRQLMNNAMGPVPRFFLLNTYGMFGAVGKVRDEWVIEGTHDFVPSEIADWHEYEFKAKAGDLKRPPPIITPYYYRLDWQIWIGTLGVNPDWMYSFIWHLLENDPVTLGLLAKNPFPDDPPRYIRVVHYRYKFAEPGNPDGNWWTRERVGLLVRPISLENAALRTQLQAMGWLPEKE